MKLNISYPTTGLQKVIEVDDEKKLRAFYDKRMSHEVDGQELGDEFKGYVFRISGGNDKQGFPMKQGVLTASRVRVLMDKGASCFRPRRRGERKRKSVRGCIVSSELSVLNLVIVKKGEQDIPGLTDSIKPRRRGPKRASRIRKLFNLDKKDDVRQYVIRREINKNGKKFTKAPKIQRLVTPRRLQHRRQIRAEKRHRYEKSRTEAKEYTDLITKRAKEVREAERAKKRSHSRRDSSKAEDAKDKTTAPPAKQAKKEEKKAAPATKGKDEKKAAAPAKGKEEKKAAAAPAPAAAKGKDAKKGKAEEKKPAAAPAPAAKGKDAKKPATESKAPAKEAAKKPAAESKAPAKEAPKKQEAKKEEKKSQPKKQAPKKGSK